MPENDAFNRTFISIDFPDEIIKEVARIQSLLVNQKFTGKLTELENLHLTLKFLGEIPKETLDEATRILEKIKFPVLNLKLGPVGRFSHQGQPRIVWIKIEGKDIFNLQKEIDKSLQTISHKEERFMSHATIARIKYIEDKSRFKQYIKGVKPKQINFQVKSFKLNKSELKPRGPLYTSLKEFKSE